MQKEAKARIKINKHLEDADGWIIDDEKGNANVMLEKNVKVTAQTIDRLGI